MLSLSFPIRIPDTSQMPKGSGSQELCSSRVMPSFSTYAKIVKNKKNIPYKAINPCCYSLFTHVVKSGVDWGFLLSLCRNLCTNERKHLSSWTKFLKPWYFVYLKVGLFCYLHWFCKNQWKKLKYVLCLSRKERRHRWRFYRPSWTIARRIQRKG